jgi:hypothetical protein
MENIHRDDHLQDHILLIPTQTTCLLKTTKHHMGINSIHVKTMHHYQTQRHIINKWVLLTTLSCFLIEFLGINKIMINIPSLQISLDNRTGVAVHYDHHHLCSLAKSDAYLVGASTNIVCSRSLLWIPWLPTFISWWFNFITHPLQHTRLLWKQTHSHLIISVLLRKY